MNDAVQQDPYQQLKEAEDAGKRIQANRGPKDADGEPISDNWETLTDKAKWSCKPHLYRVHPDDVEMPAAAETVEA